MGGPQSYSKVTRTVAMPELLAVLAELHGHGHRLALVTRVDPEAACASGETRCDDPPGAGEPEPKPKPEPKVLSGPIERGTHRSPLDHGVIVRPLTATLDGVGLNRDIVTRILRDHITELRSCYYTTGLRHDPKMSGAITIEFAISGRGRVIVAGVLASSGSLSPALGECFAVAFRRWRFPKPRGGDPVVVHSPFELRPK